MTGIELRQKREAMGLSQVELAAILRVKQATVSGCETGKRAISYPVGLALIEVERQQKKGTRSP